MNPSVDGAEILAALGYNVSPTETPGPGYGSLIRSLKRSSMSELERPPK